MDDAPQGVAADVALEGQGGVGGGGQPAESAAPQGGMGLAQGDGALIEGEEVAVGPAGARLGQGAVVAEGFVVVGDVVPEHGLAVARIVGAPHADLGAIVDHGCAGAGHLPDDRQLQGGFGRGSGAGGDQLRGVGHAGPVEVWLPVGERGAVTLKHGQDAAGVVGVEQILQDVDGARRMAVMQDVDAALEFGGIDGVGVGGKEGDGGIGPLVVHDGGKLVGLKPWLGGADNFGSGVGFGIDVADEGVPLAPEGVGQAVGHIEPPAINTFAGAALAGGIHPAAGDVEEVLLDAGVEGVLVAAEAGQDPAAIPTGVVEAAVGMPLGHLIPVAVGGVFPVAHNVLEGEAADAGMVEDAIQNDPHAAGVDVGDEVQKVAVGGGPDPGGGVFGFAGGGDGAQIAFAVGPEGGVNVMEAGGIVFVERGGLKDGVEVERVDAELLEIGELLAQADQVAAVASMKHGGPEAGGVGGFPVVAGVPLHAPGCDAPIGEVLAAEVLGARIGLGAAVAEALGKRLIPDGVLGPVGGDGRVGLGQVADG